MEKDKDLYKPLPNNECIKLTIEKSKVHGLGLFTQLFVPRGVKFGVSHIKIKDELIRTPLGGFLNHSKESNTTIIQLNQWDDYKIFNLISTCKIYKGEEVLLNYENGDSKGMVYNDAESREYDIQVAIDAD